VPAGDVTSSGAAEQAVREVHRRYATAIDGHDAGAFAAAFTPNGVLVASTGEVTAGRDALAAFARRWIDAHATESTEHSCAEHRVSAAAGSMESTCAATIAVIAPDGARSILFRATYRDVIALHEGEWLIERREVSVRTAPDN
jgi:uncharacterized protein (TIGR02246 family)